MLKAKLEKPFMILVAWAFLAILYVTLSGSIEPAAVVAALVCASASLAIAIPLLGSERTSGRIGFSPRLDARIARQVSRDTIAVARASLLALRDFATHHDRNAGVFRERHLQSNTRADIVALVLSLAPNSYVVDIRRQDERVVFHHLIAPEDDDPSRDAWPP